MGRRKQLKFIDLFAGLGGFHIALDRLGCKCVFASELRADLQALYKKNFPKTPRIEGDITKVDLASIPQHDILCAGFPCQPFSQAGYRQGFLDEKGRGNMFNYICEIIRLKEDNKPSFLLLENVANLRGHDDGNTWNTIKNRLDELGYEVYDDIISPHEYGYPQHRKRIYIVGVRKDIVEENWMAPFEFPVSDGTPICDINSIIDENDENIQPLSLKTHYQLKVWQKFIDLVLKHNLHIPAFPIWAMEFGASYRYKDLAPAFQQRKDLRGRKGKLGWIINGPSKADCLAQLPIYAQTATDEVFPDWKIRYIEQNRTFYEENERWLKGWRRLIEDWDNSHQKLEWNCGGDDDGKIFTKIVQFRASGIRVKLPTYSPALNLVGTQIPIIPWVKLPKSKVKAYTKEELEEYGLTRKDVQFGRYLSTREAAILQGMEDLDFNGLAPTRIYEALGNAVNTQVVEMIARSLIQRYCYGKD